MQTSSLQTPLREATHKILLQPFSFQTTFRIAVCVQYQHMSSVILCVIWFSIQRLLTAVVNLAFENDSFPVDTTRFCFLL